MRRRVRLRFPTEFYLLQLFVLKQRITRWNPVCVGVVSEQGTNKIDQKKSDKEVFGFRET